MKTVPQWSNQILHTIISYIFSQGFKDFSRVYIFLGVTRVDFLEETLYMYVLLSGASCATGDLISQIFSVVHDRFLPLPKSPNSAKFALRTFSVGPWSFLKKWTVEALSCYIFKNVSGIL